MNIRFDSGAPLPWGPLAVGPVVIDCELADADRVLMTIPLGQIVSASLSIAGSYRPHRVRWRGMVDLASIPKVLVSGLGDQPSDQEWPTWWITDLVVEALVVEAKESKGQLTQGKGN